MARVPLLGGAYQMRSLIAGAQRSVNLFSENNPGEAQSPVPVTTYPTPGLRFLGRPSDQPGTPDPIPAPSFTATGVHFDGSTLVTAASLTAADSPTLSFSYWFQITDAPLNLTGWAVDPTGTDVAFDFVTGDGAGGGGYDVAVRDPALTARYELDITGPTTVAVWHNVLYSADVDHASGGRVGKLYLDGADATAIANDTGLAFTLICNGLPFYVGGDTFENFTGDMAEFWWSTESLLVAGDIPPATVAKFISGGAPVDLGADGSTPTGTAPAIYLSRRSGDAVSAFAINRGTGGAFTVSAGALTASATNPSL